MGPVIGLYLASFAAHVPRTYGVCSCPMISGSGEPRAALSSCWARPRPFFFYPLLFSFFFPSPFTFFGILGGACRCCCRCVCVELLLCWTRSSSAVPRNLPRILLVHFSPLFPFTISTFTLLTYPVVLNPFRCKHSCPSWTLLYYYNNFFSAPILHALSCVLGPPVRPFQSQLTVILFVGPSPAPDSSPFA